MCIYNTTSHMYTCMYIYICTCIHTFVHVYIYMYMCMLYAYTIRGSFRGGREAIAPPDQMLPPLDLTIPERTKTPTGMQVYHQWYRQRSLFPTLPFSPLQCSSSIAAPSSNTAPSGMPLNPVQPSPSLPGHSFNLPFENWVYQAQAAVYRYTCVHVHVYMYMCLYIYQCTCTNVHVHVHVHLCRLPTDIHCTLYHQAV